MDVKNVLSHLACAGRKAYLLDREMHNLGYDNTPYFDIFGGIADAVYVILGEKCDFDDSATAIFFSDMRVSDTQCADGLFGVYRQNTGEPIFSDSTMTIISGAAAEKGISPQNMISLIVAEWAMRWHVTQCLKAV